MRSTRYCLCFVGIVGTCSATWTSRAQQTTTPGDVVALYESGKRAFAAGEYQQALELFRQAQATFPSARHAQGAAACLYYLRRYDEALEMYEELTTKFDKQIDGVTKSSAVKRMSDLRKLVGRIELSSNVDGVVVVDARERGKLPLQKPLYVLLGRHRLRVLKDGYETFERDISVGLGETVPVDARLNPIGRRGRLRVEGARELNGAELFIDGEPVGQLPWEGSIAPGSHLIFVDGGDRGSALQRIVVEENKVRRVEVGARVLGAELRLVPPSATAEISVDGVPLGKGAWRGRLPVGKHRIDVVDKRSELDVQTLYIPNEDGKETYGRVLETGRSGSRWSRPIRRGRWIDFVGGMAVGRTLRSGAESKCHTGACSFARGFFAGVRGGYEVWNGFSLEVTLGYLQLMSRAARALVDSHGDLHATYRIEDDIEIFAPFLSAGVGYRSIVWRDVVGFQVRAHAFVLGAVARDTMSIHASSDRKTWVAARVTNPMALTSGVALLAMPEAHVAFTIGQWRTAVGLGLGVQLVGGRDHDHGEVVVDRGGVVCRKYPAPVQCAKGIALKEQAYGPFLVWMPQFSLGRQF